MVTSGAAATTYGHYYYRYYAGPGDHQLPYGRSEHWLRFFGYIAERIVLDIAPSTVLDAGCAMGLLVEGLRDRGVDARGIDISEYALERARDDVRPYCTRASVVEPFGRRFGLITCIETLEHLPEVEAERAVENICAHTDDVIFSSTPDHFKDATHLNVRPAEHWAQAFARHGLFRDVDYPASYVAPWAVRLRRRTEPFARIAAEYERLAARLETENQALRELSRERQDQLAATLDRLAAAQGELEAIRASARWRIAANIAWVVDRVLPPGSRRLAIMNRARQASRCTS